MSTPIEIVRAQRKWFLEESDYSAPPSTSAEYMAALASVLADAERFKALELAHLDARIKQGWATFDEVNEKYWCEFAPLAEIADRLREGA